MRSTSSLRRGLRRPRLPSRQRGRVALPRLPPLPRAAALPRRTATGLDLARPMAPAVAPPNGTGSGHRHADGSQAERLWVTRARYVAPGCPVSTTQCLATSPHHGPSTDRSGRPAAAMASLRPHPTSNCASVTVRQATNAQASAISTPTVTECRHLATYALHAQLRNAEIRSFQGQGNGKAPGQRHDLGLTMEPPKGIEPLTYALRDHERS